LLITEENDDRYILSFPRAGGPPNSLPKVDGAGDYIFLGAVGFFLRGAKKISFVPLASVLGLWLLGAPPRGGVPPRGGPPLGGGPPLLSKTECVEKFEKEDALSRPYAHFGPQKPCFWGGTQNDRFWPFLGVLGGIPGIPHLYRTVCKKKKSSPFFCGYAHVISHTVARIKYQNRGPIAQQA
jgi:hypothetical protein